MKRPFLFTGCAALTASFLAPDKSPWMIAVFLIVCCAACILLMVKDVSQIYKGAVVALVFIFITLRMVSAINQIETDMLSLAGRTTKITGRVTKIIRDEDNYSLYGIKVEESSIPAAVNETVKASVFYNAGVSAGDRVTATVVFEETPLKYKLSDFSKGYYHSCEIQKVSVLERDSLTVWSIAHRLRKGIAKSIEMSGGAQATALLKALIIGDTSEVSPDFMQSVKETGVSHMLVVSGMHLGIVCGMLMRALGNKTGRVASALIGIAAVGFIAIVCLFHVSVLRASIAYFVMLFGKLIFRNADSLSSLGFGMTVAVFAFPYIFYDAAFMLSVTATFAVIYPGKMLTDIVSFDRFGKMGVVYTYLWDTFMISLSALFCTLPVVAYYFGFVSAVAPITNLAVTFAINIALILGAIATVVYFIPFVGVFCCVPLYFGAGIFIYYFIFAINFIASFVFDVINIREEENIYCFLISISYILLVKTVCVLINKRKEKMLSAQRQDP